MYQVTFQFENGAQEVKFSAAPGSTILEAAKSANVAIDAPCSGNGSCGKCRVKLLEGTHCRVLDTRKTTPGMRVLDKMAVKLGGGENHRMGLFDMILLKDNHIDFAGGIANALGAVRGYLADTGRQLPIEVEVRSLEDIDEVFAAGGADRIMFDNFTVEMTREGVRRIAGRCETESSGGIREETMRAYAECGVDYVSVGALTHQIRSLDMSLKACV